MKNNGEIVIFRTFADGEVCALFPQQEQLRRGDVGCYEVIGQHGTADYMHVIANSRPSTKAESASLRDELVNIVGYKLNEKKRGQYKYMWWFKK